MYTGLCPLRQFAAKLTRVRTQNFYGGRFHLRRLLDRIATLRCPWHRSRVTKEMRLDIDWWLRFLRTFNGTMPLVDCRPATPISIDACTEAAGAFNQGDWVYTHWQTHWPRAASLHINYKEVLALEPAVTRWSHLWAGKKVFVHSDNQAAVAIINKGSCRDSFVMQSLAQGLLGVGHLQLPAEGGILPRRQERRCRRSLPPSRVGRSRTLT